ncbi:MAG TPA: hypothetical protein VI588_01925 [Candidatus Gracilibacteria bacterium]|nr:hypothetical protein [Candidatus Gracilibacteria bacterium]
MKNTFLKRKLAEGRFVFFAGPEGGPETEKKATPPPEGDKGEPMNPDMADDDAKAKAAKMGESFSAVPLDAGKEKQAEEAKKYIVINDTIKQKISKIAEIEASLTADDPEKRAKIDKDLLAVVKPMLAVIKSDKDNAKLIDHVLKKDSEGAGQARPGFVPSVESKQLFANYKSTGELEGGMAIADDMSDVPGLVAEGNLDFNKFKKRTDLWDKGIDVALAEVEKVKKKYS